MTQPAELEAGTDDTVILVRLPDKYAWRDPDGVAEYIDTWGAVTLDEAVETAQRIIASNGEIGDEYELLEVVIRRRVVVKAQRVGVVAPLEPACSSG